MLNTYGANYPSIADPSIAIPDLKVILGLCNRWRKKKSLLVTKSLIQSNTVHSRKTGEIVAKFLSVKSIYLVYRNGITDFNKYISFDVISKFLLNKKIQS